MMQEAREAAGVRLQGSVIIVDEAHNLVDAVNSAHSVAINAATATEASAQLEGYWARYSTRLSPGMLHHCRSSSYPPPRASRFWLARWASSFQFQTDYQQAVFSITELLTVMCTALHSDMNAGICVVSGFFGCSRLPVHQQILLVTRRPTVISASLTSFANHASFAK